MTTDRTDKSTGRRRIQRMGDVLANLLARRGYARVESTSAEAKAWGEVAGERFAPHSRPGNVRRGVLEVLVRSSAVMQELMFEKKRLLRDLAKQLPERKIRDLRFRVGVID